MSAEKMNGTAQGGRAEKRTLTGELQHRYALSKEGARDMLKAFGACTASNIALSAAFSSTFIVLRLGTLDLAFNFSDNAGSEFKIEVSISTSSVSTTLR